MTLKQLYKLQKDVENAIQVAKSRELELAKKKLEKEAQKLGYSLSELLDSTPSKETAQRALRKSVATKYHPPPITTKLGQVADANRFGCKPRSMPENPCKTWKYREPAHTLSISPRPTVTIVNKKAKRLKAIGSDVA